MNIPTYNQPEKQAARRRILERAVSALTNERTSSVIVNADEFAETIERAAQLLSTIGFDTDALNETRSRAREWERFQRSAVGARSPADLRVLYLCGPEPRNDLEVLLDLGVLPQNVWAIEAERELYGKAVEQLLESNSYIRVHHGSLETFFDTTNEQFDIVYIDACGPLPGGRPSTIKAPLLMYHYERLAPLGVLITNFSQPGEEKRTEYKKLFANYFATRRNDVPQPLLESVEPAIMQYEPSQLWLPIEHHFDETYSDFLTRFLVDIGREIVPRARVYSNPDVRKKYFASEDVIKSVLTRAQRTYPPDEPGDTPETYIERLYATVGDIHINPSGYPVLNFLRRCAADKEVQPLLASMLEYRIRGELVKDSYERTIMLASVLEGHWEIASPEMLAALRSSWFDKRGGVFCDVPLPHLLINSMFGIYGRPFFPNPRPSLRFSYTAKTRKMYTDVLVLDQCRYYFDFLPTIDLIPRRLESIAFQLVLRTCLDRIGRHDWSSASHPFHGAALVGFGDVACATAYEFHERSRSPAATAAENGNA